MLYISPAETKHCVKEGTLEERFEASETGHCDAEDISDKSSFKLSEDNAAVSKKANRTTEKIRMKRRNVFFIFNILPKYQILFSKITFFEGEKVHLIQLLAFS